MRRGPDLKPVVGVQLLDFTFFEGHPSALRHFEMRDRRDPDEPRDGPLDGGLDAWIAPNVGLGIGYRLVTGADLSLGGEDVSGDYSQVTLSVGFSF